MPIKKRAIALAVAAVSALAAPVVVATPAIATPTNAGPDFDGDGLTDVAIGAKDGLQTASGTIVVDYSSDLSTDLLRPYAYEYDGFGDSFAIGDLDGDGFDDLVAGCTSCEWEWNGPTVTVFKGSIDGLRLDDTVDIELGSPNSAVAIGELTDDPGLEVASTRDGTSVTITSHDGDAWRQAVYPLDGAPANEGVPSIIVDDATGDGEADIIIGSPSAEQGGAITVIEGVQSGQPTHSVRFGSEFGDGIAGFGADVAVADIDGDQINDMIVGAPRSVEAGFEPCGVVVTVTNTGATRTIGQETEGVPGICEDGDAWGSQVEAADLFGTDAAEIIVGAPGEAIYDDAAAGGVVVLHCVDMDCAGSVAITQLDSNIPAKPEPGDRFGATLRVQWPLTDSARPGLMIGAPGEDVKSTVDAGWALIAELDDSGAPTSSSYAVTGVLYDTSMLGSSL